MKQRPGSCSVNYIAQLTIIRLVKCLDFQNDRRSCFRNVSLSRLSVDGVLGDSGTFNVDFRESYSSYSGCGVDSLE